MPDPIDYSRDELSHHGFNLGLYANELIEACEARDDFYAGFVVARIIVETNMARTAMKLVQDGGKERERPALAGAA